MSDNAEAFNPLVSVVIVNWRAPDETLEACLASDAVLLGAVGGPQWAAVPYEARPEAGLYV